MGEILDSKWRDFLDNINKRESCDISCPIYSNCCLSINAPHCMLKDMLDEDRKRYFNLFFLGEDGMRAEILKVLFDFAQSLNMETSEEISRYLDALLKVNRQFYGEKSKVQKPVEELKVDIKRVEKKPRPTLALVQDDSTSDPESLFNSERLDNIVARI